MMTMFAGDDEVSKLMHNMLTWVRPICMRNAISTIDVI